MAPGAEGAPPFARQQDRKVVVVVSVGITQAGSVDQHAMVEKRSLPFRNRLQPGHKAGEVREVKVVNFRDLRQLLRVASVMREVMVPVPDSEERVLPVAAVMG